MWHSRFLCNIALYSIRPFFYHQSIHNWVLFLLWLHPFILSGVISPLISSSIFGTYRPGEFLFQYLIILPFYYSWGSQGKNTEVVCHSLLQWTTFCQPSLPWPILLGWPHLAWVSFTELDKAVVCVIRLASFLWLWFQCVCLWSPLATPTVLLGFLFARTHPHILYFIEIPLNFLLILGERDNANAWILDPNSTWVRSLSLEVFTHHSYFSSPLFPLSSLTPSSPPFYPLRVALYWNFPIFIVDSVPPTIQLA